MNENRLRRIANQRRPRTRSGLLNALAVMRHAAFVAITKEPSILLRSCAMSATIAALCLTSLISPVHGQSKQLPADAARGAETTITVDLNAPSHPFPHFWEQMYGSGRAVLSLRESYRDDLREV